jgi:hypothetical protein
VTVYRAVKLIGAWSSEMGEQRPTDSEQAEERQPLNRLRVLRREGKPALGVLVTMPSIQVVQVLAHAGFDFLLIDLEHGPIDPATAHLSHVLVS